MKRLLSIILTITMFGALIPSVFAVDETYKYEFYNSSWFERGNPVAQKRTFQTAATYYHSLTTESLEDVEWEYIGSSTSTSEGISTSDTPNKTNYNMVVGNFNTYATRAVAKSAGEWIAFKIEIPKSGIYTVDVKSYLYTSATTDVDVFLLPASAKVSVGGYTGELVGAFADSRVYGTYSEVFASDGVKYACKRENAKSFDEFAFSTIDPDEYKVIDSGNTYKRQSTSTAKTEGIQSISASSAEIEVTAGIYVLLVRANEVGEINIGSLTLTSVAEEETTSTELTGNISFAAGADIQYKIAEETYTSISANNTVQIPVASSVTVKVTDTEDFAGWVRGTKDSGVWVSSDPEYEFYIMSPTYLTPVYTTPEETATHAVEFWDENGAYVDTITATNGKAVLPTSGYGVVGGSLNGWWIDEETQLLEGDIVAEGITRAVAQYNYGDFGKSIFNSDDSAKYWKRDDITVAYGSEYTYYQWNGAETITFGTEAIEKNPLVVLDSTPVDGAYMIEYDKGNASEIVEAGILFGSTAEIHIGSTDGSKAASQRNGVDENVDDGHGQFCAKPNAKGSSDYARGYLIYRGTDNKLYVIYTAALATSAQ